MAPRKNPRPELSKLIFFTIMARYEQWRKDHAMWTEYLRTHFSEKRIGQLAPEPSFTVGSVVEDILVMGGWSGEKTEIAVEVGAYRRWFSHFNGESKDRFTGVESYMMKGYKKPIRAAVQHALDRMVKTGALTTAICESPMTGKEARCYEPTDKAWDAWPRIKAKGQRSRRRRR